MQSGPISVTAADPTLENKKPHSDLLRLEKPAPVMMVILLECLGRVSNRVAKTGDARTIARPIFWVDELVLERVSVREGKEQAR